MMEANNSKRQTDSAGNRVLQKLKSALQGKLAHKLGTFKYPLIILLIGLFLVLLPKRQSSAVTQKTDTPVETAQEQSALLPTAEQYRVDMERALGTALSKIEGAGRVEVLLTLKNGGTTQYLSDEESIIQQDADSVSTTTRQSTVLFERGSAYDEATVIKTEYPVFQGALIVSEGADNAAVRLALYNAVSSLLGLSTDKITVVKMR